MHLSEISMPDMIQTIVDFLTDIGIPAHEGPVANGSFLPGLCIENGALVYDIAALRWPGDLLHEAGHIATMPAALRGMLHDSLEQLPTVAHASEIEATAWAYAAVVHLGIEASVLFHPDGYHGKSSELIATYSLGVYPGCFGLAQAGMTLLDAEAASAAVAPYPHMIKWLRD
jgi:hypothetical protein